MLDGHGGNIYETAQRFGYPQDHIIDMSSNINPLGPPSGLLDFLKCNLSRVTRLPEVDSRLTLKAFAAFLEIDSDYMLAGNGTTQFIYLLPSVLGIRKALIIGPTYGDYGDACKINDEIQAFVQKTRNFIQEQREEIGRSLRDISAIKLYPSATPFFLVRLPQAVPAESAWISLAREKILIRNCSNFPGLSDRFIRIALKAREANQLLVEKMRTLVTASNKLYQSLPRKQNVGV